MQWCKDNGYRPMNAKNFVSELRRRCDVRRDGKMAMLWSGWRCLGTLIPYRARLFPLTDICKAAENCYHS